MRIKLRLNKETRESIQEELMEKNIEIAEDANLILTEEEYIGDSVECKDEDGIVFINTESICYMESIGHDVYVYTDEKKYKTKYRIYQLERLLPSERFIRISNSVIIKKNSIRHIKPALSCKFYLTLTNGDVVDVTRTYFYKLGYLDEDSVFQITMSLLDEKAEMEYAEADERAYAEDKGEFPKAEDYAVSVGSVCIVMEK